MVIPNFSLTANRIVLIGHGRYEEALVEAGQTITPGQLLKLDSDGGVAVHGTSGGAAERQVAIEDVAQGHGLLDTYAAGSLCFLYEAVPGDVLLMFLATGQNVAEGALLMSNGAGYLTALQSTDVVIAVALAALNLSASGALTTLLRVRIV